MSNAFNKVRDPVWEESLINIPQGKAEKSLPMTFARNPAMMTFAEFSAMNKERCESPTGFKHKLESWDMNKWMVATLGELGEAANIIKKLNRHADNVTNTGDTSVTDLWYRLADELADTFIYLDLMVARCGFDLQTIVLNKFAITSDKIGYVPMTDQQKLAT